MLCIPQKVADIFKKALQGRDIQIADLIKMTPEARTALFEKYGGENAKTIETLFEQKLILKNKVTGLKNFISQITALGKYNPEKIAELKKLAEEYHQMQLERILNPKQEQTFLNNLADKFAGSHITKEEAGNLSNFISALDTLKQQFNGKEWSSEKAGKEYGAAKVILDNYVEQLKYGKQQTLKEMLIERLGQFKKTYSENAPKAVSDLLMDTLKLLTDTSISVVASVDNSFLGRQGLKTLMTHPSVWWEGAKNSFSDIAGTLGGKNMKDALMTDVYSHPNYILGRYDLAKILPKTEEQFPTSLPERVPIAGRVFKASQVAFEGSAIRMRTGLYDLISNIAEKNGVDVSDKYQIQSMGKVINSLTARGQFGTRGESTIVRLVLWAPKMLKANFDVLTGHLGQDISPFARKQAAINLAKIVATSAGIITIANAIKPGSAEIDPRSSNFGKIKVGNTTFDYTGGAGSLIVLGARLLTGESKNTATGLVRPFGTGYGQQTRFSTIIDFLTGKTTPPVGAIIAMFKGTDFTGQKTTLGNTIARVVVPISLQNVYQLKDDNSAQAVLGVILDALGANANTYKAGSVDWKQSQSQKLIAFQKKVGDTKFKEANDAYNQQVAVWLSQVKNNPKYNALSSEDKQKVITNKKDDIKNAILRKYGFSYHEKKSAKLPKF